jgi:hypothetical protein
VDHNDQFNSAGDDGAQVSRLWSGRAGTRLRRRHAARTVVGAAIAIALGASGVVMGRALSDPDEVRLAVPTDRPPGALVEVPVLDAVGIGAVAPLPVPDDDPTFGLGSIVGVDLVSPEQVSLDQVVTDGSVIDGTVPADASIGDLDLGAASTSSPLIDASTISVGGVVPIEVALAESALLEPADTTTGPAAPDSSTGAADSSSGVDGLRTIDPCAPVDGESVPDCPDGLRSTVLAISAPPALWLDARVEDRGSTTPAGDSCPPEEVTAGQRRLVLVANAPGAIEVTLYRRRAAGLRGVDRTFTLTTGPDDQARWEMALAEATDFSTLGVALAMRHCAVIDVEDDFLYEFNAEMVDIFDRHASNGGGFNTLVPLSRPPTIVVPVDATQVFVSVPHTTSQHVEIVGEVNDDPSSQCGSGFGGDPSTRLTMSAIERMDVDPDLLAARHYISSYVRRTWTLVSVPEGARALLCMRTTDDDRPSFDSVVLVESVVVQAPDLIVPIVSVEDVRVRNQLPEGTIVKVSLSHVDGPTCGRYLGSVSREGTMTDESRTACDPTADAVGSATRLTRPVLVTSSVTFPGGAGEPVVTSGVIPAGAQPCRRSDSFGSYCPAIPTAWYRVPLPAAVVSSGLCGSVFGGGCTPPTTERVAGSALIEVAWVQGTSNGRSSWAVGTIDDVSTARPSAEFPLLDVRRRLTVTPGDMPTVSGNLLADRPADWHIAIADGDCTLPGGQTVAESEAPTAEFRFFLTGFCPEHLYSLVVTLTDPETGTSVDYGAGDPHSLGWAGASVYTAATEYPLSATLTAGNPPGGEFRPEVMRVRIGPVDSPSLPDFDFTTPVPDIVCDGGRVDPRTRLRGATRQSLSRSTKLTQMVRIDVSVSIRLITSSSSSATRHVCSADGGRPLTVSFTTTVSRDQLEQAGGVVVSSAPGSSFPVALALSIG